MGKYDDLFAGASPEESVFREKGLLDPLRPAEEIVARDEQERELARLLQGVHEGYLPTTVAVYGPPGTGKTLTVRRVCREFADRTPKFGFEYVNLKECRTLFSVANEILFELAGERKESYAGLDGAFEAIWAALESYPEWTVLILDEIDHLRGGSHDDPNDFFYRLLRGEGKLERGLNLSVVLVSNELLSVDLRLDSRVESAMSGEEVFFPPYDRDELAAVLEPRLDRAFEPGALPADVREYGLTQAATRWGDARKALTLFRRAGETANERGLETVTRACVEANVRGTEREAVRTKLGRLPLQHFLLLDIIADLAAAESAPVSTPAIRERYRASELPEELRIAERTIRDLVTDLKTMGLVETWIESRGRGGRAKQIELAFDPAVLDDVRDEHAGAAGDALDVLSDRSAEADRD